MNAAHVKARNYLNRRMTLLSR